MEDGLEVNIDEFFGEGSTSIPSFGDGEGFSWADDFITSATEKPISANTTTINVLPSSIAQVSQSQDASSNRSFQQITPTTTVLGGQQTFVQQFPTIVNLQGQNQVQIPAGFIQGSSFRHAKYRKKGFHSVPQFVKSTSATAIPTVQAQPLQVQARSSPSPVRSPFSSNSPMISRSVTPSCSPAPSASPLISRSITPNTQSAIVTANSNRPPSHSNSPAPSLNVFNQFNHNNSNIQSRQQVQFTNTVPIQGLMQNPSLNTNTNSIMTGQSSLTPNIVHTQNAVIQNPNVVNLNVAHVLCNNSQTMGQQGVQTVQNPIQGTIIQTAEGKNILIPNSQLQGQQLNLGGLTNIAQPNQVGQQIIQNQQNLGNMIRLAPSQGKPQTFSQPNYSFVNLGGQGQQILIQRPPTASQPQNIILRGVQPNLIVQQSGQTGQQTLQPQQIQQQIFNPQTPQNLQFQQVLSGGQQMRIVTNSGQLPTQSGAVTLNLAGQNLNLQQLSNMGTNNFQGIQLANGQFILQPQQKQAVQQPQHQQHIPITTLQTAAKVSTSSVPVPASMSTSQTVDPLTQALSLSGITENGSTYSDPSPAPTPTPPPVEVAKKSKPKSKKSNEGRHQQTSQATISSQQNVSVPLSQVMETAASSAGVFSTAQNTIVTTTISQSFVQSHNALSVASSSTVDQLISSVSQPSNLIQSSQVRGGNQVVNIGQLSTNIQQKSNITVPQASIASTNQHLQRIDADIKKLMGLKTLTMEQKQQLHGLSMLKQKLVNSTQLNISQPQQSVQMVGQPQLGTSITQQPIAQPPVLQVGSSVQQQATPSKHFVHSVQNLQSTVSSSFQPSQSSIVSFNMTQPQTSTSVLPTSSNLQSTNLVQIQPAQSTAPRPIMSSGNLMSTPAGKLPIPAIPAVPTQIKFGNQILTLNLTPQQKEKLSMHLSKMTVEQQEQFLKQQSTLKLQQKQQQIKALQQAAAAQQAQKTTVLGGSSTTQLPVAVQVSGTPVKTEPIQQMTPNRGSRLLPPEIPKASLIHQQMSKDQQNAIGPDTKAPFKNSREACRRLLRYHVFQWAGPSEAEHERADNMMELRSAELLQKSRIMMAKYRHLLLKDSMREDPSAEMVMIQRMLHQDLKACIKEEKRIAEEDPESFQPLPAKYLKTKDSKSDESCEEEKLVKKESSFEEDSGAMDTSEDSESIPQVSLEKPPEQPTFKNSPSSGTMRLLIRKQSHGFVSTLASEESDCKSSPSRALVKTEPFDSGYEIQSDCVLSKTTCSVSRSEPNSLKTRIKLETSEIKNPLHIHIGGDVDIHHDSSYQHSDESYEDYKDSVLISRDMSNMSHTDVSDTSMTEDGHAELDSSISPNIPSHRTSDDRESKKLRNLTVSVGETLTESLCSDQSGHERGDLVDSVESGPFSSGSPAYHSGFSVSRHNVNEDENMFDPSDSYSSRIPFKKNRSDLARETYSAQLSSAGSVKDDFKSVSSSEIQSHRSNINPSFPISYHHQTSSTEVLELGQSEQDEFNTSFSSDTQADQPHALLNNQMQSAIESILDNEDDGEDDFSAGQSNSYNSQEVSEEDDSSAGEDCGSAKGDTSDVENDLDAAVNSILM